jgi:hypothetical protein
MGDFRRVGIPGAVGSMDCTHVRWDMCPAEWSKYFTGKEGFPTVAYQVICDHSGFIMSCTPGFYGSCNDKTIVRFDNVINALKEGTIYGNVKWKLYTLEKVNGEYVQEELTRPFVIVDGGYHKWCVTMTASSMCSDPNFRLWQKRMESVRKDIECVFGRLKKRFQILKNAIVYHKKHEVDNVFITCCILYNMLHVWDGLGEWISNADLAENMANELDVNDAETIGTNYEDVLRNRPGNIDFSLSGLRHFSPTTSVSNEPFDENVNLFPQRAETIPAPLLAARDRNLEVLCL